MEACIDCNGTGYQENPWCGAQLCTCKGGPCRPCDGTGLVQAKSCKCRVCRMDGGACKADTDEGYCRNCQNQGWV